MSMQDRELLAVMRNHSEGLHSVADRCRDADLKAAMRERAKEFDEARAAVAELIEADKEYDAATAHYDSPEGYTKDGNERLRAAKARRAAALARVQGGQS